jgi:uncharacterized protein YuzE
MRITYDPEVDVLMVYLDETKGRRVKGDDLPYGSAYADLALDGTILELEITNASKRYPANVLLEATKPAYDPMSLAEASVIAGVTPQALKKAIQRGKLAGRQIGGSWVVVGPDLDAYLNARWQREPHAAAL